VYARKDSRIFPNCDNSLGSLTVPASAARDFVKLILLCDSTHFSDQSEFRTREYITYFVQTNPYEKQAQHDFISSTLQKDHFRPLSRYVLVDLWIVFRIPVWTNHTHSANSCPILEYKSLSFQCVPRVILLECKSDHGPHLVARLKVSLTILPLLTCLYGQHRDKSDVKTFIFKCNCTLFCEVTACLVCRSVTLEMLVTIGNLPVRVTVQNKELWFALCLYRRRNLT
jgi:hypothetical protein